MKRTLLAVLLAGMTGATVHAQNRESLIGCWTMQGRHGAETLSLNRNGRFVFNDWNSRRGDFETLTGKWTMSRGNSVSLLYDDRSKQSFTLRRERGGRWMLTKAGGFMLYKGDPSECTRR